MASRREQVGGEHVQWAQEDSPVTVRSVLQNSTWSGAKKYCRGCSDHCCKTRGVEKRV